MGFLANPGDPYVHADGHVTRKEGKREVIVDDYTVGAPRVAKMLISSSRNLSDMPANDPTAQKAINVILVYHLLGLTVNEISHTLGIDMDSIHEIMDMDAFQETFEAMFQEIISLNSNSMQAKIARASQSALQQVINLSAEADKDIVKLKASQDILDRSGLAADHLHGKSSDLEDVGFKIIVEDAANAPDASKLNIDINIGKKRR